MAIGPTENSVIALSSYVLQILIPFIEAKRKPDPRCVAETCPYWHYCLRPGRKCSSEPCGLIGECFICPGVCKLYCRWGNVRDENGCKICKCLPRPMRQKEKKCPRVCKVHCLWGKVKDSNGCPICKCKPRPRRLRKHRHRINWRRGHRNQSNRPFIGSRGRMREPHS
ncbi:cysteine-rich motor neuron 1 protein [Plakobranchus ocellatus]|uniref:Cysteine-rich motor neuron 1 protein n=1 Tax=Plakobranchus ocellatus TaxID=259542 RepID=A0AAV3YWV0_9GAST|nr:cysteine-rich motor neuron 1 protein [Plakobranchus ocellatus]